jgi:hypothetical protein
MNLLHGDHTAAPREEEAFSVVMHGYEVGSPCAILAKGRARDMYSSRTSDVRGDRVRAE